MYGASCFEQYFYTKTDVLLEGLKNWEAYREDKNGRWAHGEMLRHPRFTQILVSKQPQFITIHIILTFPGRPDHFGTTCMWILEKLTD